MNTIKTETVIRTIVLIVALINQGLTVAGKSPLPFEEEQLVEGLSYLFTACAALWAWWKNNSFTKAAIQADEVMKTIKAGGYVEEVND